MTIRRFSSRRQRLDRSFLAARLKDALAYDRIAGYFSSSLLEIVGEELDSVRGPLRIICNSDLHPLDVQTARSAKLALWQSWTGSRPETLLESAGAVQARQRFQRLYQFLSSGKLQVRVLPDVVFGLIHGKAGVITLADGSRTCFMGSANESKSAWRMNYELVWEDPSPEAVAWVQEEFDALWGHPQAVPLSEAVVEDIERISRRQVLHHLDAWSAAPQPAAAVIEAPVYRQEVGLWEHQKYFVKTAFEAHTGPLGKARFVLADQVGLGKTIQLALAAQLMALTGSRPILIICPRTLLEQWQAEMNDLLDMPSAIWDKGRWVDERGFEYPAFGPEGLRRCPRRVGILSGGLISRGSDAVQQLLKLEYDCVILDEAHRARRRNLGPGAEEEPAEPNNLLRFMRQLALRTRSLLLATATPVQLHPVEAWDLLSLLGQGDEAVLGNPYSRWQDSAAALDLVMGKAQPPADETALWEWLRNPLPPASEHLDYDILRRRLEAPERLAVIPGDRIARLSPADLNRLNKAAARLFTEHHPFIRRIIRRTRQQLEGQIDPESGEPLLKPIKVELLGESEQEALPLTAYLREAYSAAEEFCQALAKRQKASGFLKTLLLKRVGSSLHAGLLTAQRMLGDWEHIEASAEISEEEDDEPDEPSPTPEPAAAAKDLTPDERKILERFIQAIDANQEDDPKYAVVLQCLRERRWLERGCIIFSQYRDSIQWLAGQLTQEFPAEPIALYSSPATSGVMQGGRWTPATRETLKARVKSGELRLMLGTDAASEGLNLQRLATLINLDLPWNPTRLEQRKGRIQRIGQLNDTVFVYNLRYKDSVEDRVHELLSSRLHDIYGLFGQIPDVLEDAWIAVALGEKEQARKIIAALPRQHPFEIRYTQVEKVDWESCAEVLSAQEKRRALSEGWK